MLTLWMKTRGGQLLQVAIILLLIMTGITIWRDPFDFDDRAQIERILDVAIKAVQADITVDMEDRMWSQVKLAGAGNLSSMSKAEWETTSNWFLAHHTGYLGLQLLDRNFRPMKTAELPEAANFFAGVDFVSDDHLHRLLQSATATTRQVATVPTKLANEQPGYVIAVPDFERGNFVGYLIVVADVEHTLRALLSEFNHLGYSIAVSDNLRQLYSIGVPENRKEWGKTVKIPLNELDWQVEVWPKPEMLNQVRSRAWELVAIGTLLLFVLLSSTIRFARGLSIKTTELRAAHESLEHRVRERTADLDRLNENLRMEIAERRQAEATLQMLSARVLQVQDEERRRIARELHDSTAQALSALKLSLCNAQEAANSDGRGLDDALQRSRQMAEQALTEVRTMSYLLHPPILEDFGLESAISWYAAGFEARSGIKVEVEVDPDLDRFSQDVELALYRIVQEALGNIHRHSGSQRAKISLFHTSTKVVMHVRDEGKGLNPEILEPTSGSKPRVGVGIAGMRERARELGGELRITSSKQGVALVVELPCTKAGRVSQADSVVGTS